MAKYTTKGESPRVSIYNSSELQPIQTKAVQTADVSDQQAAASCQQQDDQPAVLTVTACVETVPVPANQRSIPVPPPIPPKPKPKLEVKLRDKKELLPILKAQQDLMNEIISTNQAIRSIKDKRRNTTALDSC